MKQVTLFAGLLFAGLLLPDSALAAEWERSAGVSLSSYYSDNICRSKNDPEGRGAARVSPNLRLNGRGARGNLSLSAAVSYDSLADSSLECDTGQRPGLTNREAVVPSLRYFGDLELVEDWLTLESNASATRNAINPFAPGDIDRFDGRDNLNITYQYGAGATVQRRLFDSATMQLRYFHSEQLNAVNRFGDNSEDLGEFDLGTERGGGRLTVGISGRRSEIAYESTSQRPAFDNTFSSANFRAALRLGSTWQINALVGEEWNDFLSILPDIDGFYWDVGLRWFPNPRMEVSLGTGERFFGSTPRMSIRYRHRRSDLTAEYNRSLISPRNLRAPFLAPDDLFGPDFGQLPGDPLTVSGEPTFIGDTPITNERLSLRYRFTARRTSISIGATDSRQFRTEDAGEGNFTNLALAISRSLAGNVSANFSVNWNESEGRGANVGIFGQPATTWRVDIGLSRRLGSRTTINMGYNYTRREADADASINAFNQFTENRVTISAQHQF